MTALTDAAQTGRVGLALGGGAARGWAHIGVIRALKDAGIEPAVVAGTSVGAIVGSMVCSEHLEAFEDWVRAITRRDVVGYMDFALGNGGFIQGRRLMKRLQETIGKHRFADLQRPLGVVATDLYSGQERWLREGDLATAVRASMALPGLFTPVQINGEWLADGGLVNPVPVSLCHAMGADRVIAVNLNDGLLGRHIQAPLESVATADAQSADDPAAPGMFDVIATAVNVMQDRITRSRMAGDPPALLINPRVEHIGLLEMHRGAEAIQAGYDSVKQMGAAISAFNEG